jgi:hypothetical protein
MTDILDDCYESDLTDEEHERLILMSEHAIAKPLSPAAQGVFHAFNSKFDWVEDGVPGPQFNSIAAALRAAADQVVPPALEEEFNDRNQALPLKKMVEIRQKLNAIADELEAHQDSQ